MSAARDTATPVTPETSETPDRPAWTPFERAQRVHDNTAAGGMAQMWQNSLYTVIVGSNPEGTMASLSIRSNDREAVHDWRDFQRIKNELVGPECEAIEIYPAESRLVDTANQYFLFVFLDPAFRLGLGFQERLVADSAGSDTKARQRPFRPDERPADALTGDQMDALVRKHLGQDE